MESMGRGSDWVEMKSIQGALLGRRMIRIRNATKGTEFDADGLTGRQTEIILAGGLLNYTKKQQQPG